MDNVKKAIEAQRKKRADIQSAADSRKASAMQKRKSSLQPKSTKPAETRYNKDGQVIGSGNVGSRTDSAGMQYFGKQVASAMNAPKPVAKASAPKGPSIAQKRAAAASAPVVEKVSKPKLSPSKGPIGVAGLSKAAPKAMNVTPSRTYTDKEKQINALLMTGKKKDGTMKASAQRKIQKIRRK
jgi:hypothetical protein